MQASHFTTLPGKAGKADHARRRADCGALPPLALALAAAMLSACGGSGGGNSQEAGNVLLAGATVAVSEAAPTAVSDGATAIGTTPARQGGLALAAAPAIAPLPVPNDEGAALTFSSVGTIDSANPFFKAQGNGRSCASCHQPDNGWSITPDGLARRFEASAGLDPVFRPVDGAVSPNAATATLAQKRVAYSMLLSKGLVRVGLPLPANAEFTLVKIDDPYHYASAKELSLFRRPLPTTNLAFLSSVMWDGRETTADPASTMCLKDVRPARCFAAIDADLLHQSNSAVRGHAEAALDLSAAEQRAIVDFEKTLFTAQSSSLAAGGLSEGGALGGPVRLSRTGYYFGINDVQAGDYRSGAPFNRNALDLFGAWRNLANPPAPAAPPGRGRPAPPPPAPSAQNLARAAIARGEQIFNNKPFNISGVAGFNDELRLPLQRGTCSSCHNTPNVGSHSVTRMFNTGVAAGALRSADMPLYTLRNNATGELVDTSDPGAAMLSGRWRDIGRVKVPSLRGIESRSPYFHNGSVHLIEDVVGFYDKRFRIAYTAQEAADLAAFLKAL